MTIANEQKPAATLEQLPPLVLPEPISFWPPAIGWWLIGLLLILAIAGLVRALRKRKKSRAVLRAASIGLQKIYAVYIDDNNAQQYLYNSSQLLRRFCLSRYNNASLNTLSGEIWLAAMDDIVGQRLLNTETGKQLLTIYQPEAAADIHSLHTLLLRWLAKAPNQLPKQDN